MSTLSQILTHKIIAIIRGSKPEDVLSIAAALHKGGIRLLEITLNSPEALPLIQQLSNEMGDDLLIGAGTVLDATSADAAVAAGAKFIISPVIDTPTIHAARRHGVVSIPGAYTPTEILKAYQDGGDIIKVFPSSAGAQFIKDLRGPLPHIPLMPTGGVNLDNIAEFQKAGAVAFGIGSALVNSEHAVNPKYLKQLEDRAKKYVQEITIG
jgi:2-dehydro-3-deoxyphosphogluconate aldolase / (4S)-4-hydroxy-2-oxoglutarate aldolase